MGTAGDDVAGGVDKGGAAGKAAWAAAAFGERSGRGEEVAAKEAETMAVGLVRAVGEVGAL